MHKKKFLCIIFIIACMICFSGCKEDEMARNTIISATVIGTFTGVLNEDFVIYKLVKEWWDSDNKNEETNPPTKPPIENPTSKPTIKYEKFTDSNYDFSFSYPRQINDIVLNEMPEIIVNKTRQVEEIRQVTEQIKPIQISGRGNEVTLERNESYIQISGHGNTVILRGTNNFIVLSGHSNMLYCDGNIIDISGNGNDVEGKQNKYFISGHNNDINPNENQYLGERPKISPKTFNQKILVDKKIITYRIDLGNSCVDIETDFCNSLNELESNLKKKFKNVRKYDAKYSLICYEFTDPISKKNYITNVWFNEKNHQYYSIKIQADVKSDAEKEMQSNIIKSFKTSN